MTNCLSALDPAMQPLPLGFFFSSYRPHLSLLRASIYRSCHRHRPSLLQMSICIASISMFFSVCTLAALGCPPMSHCPPKQGSGNEGADTAERRCQDSRINREEKGYRNKPGGEAGRTRIASRRRNLMGNDSDYREILLGSGLFGIAGTK